MEDCNLLAADGVVVCCCCPCLILQLIIFILLKLPCKLARRSKQLLLRRFAKKKRKGKMKTDEVVQHGGGEMKLERELTNFLIERVSSSRCRKTFDEVEKALGELSRLGQFGFGSFWGPDEDDGSFPPDISNAAFETVLHYHFIEMFKNQ